MTGNQSSMETQHPQQCSTSKSKNSWPKFLIINPRTVAATRTKCSHFCFVINIHRFFQHLPQNMARPNEETQIAGGRDHAGHRSSSHGKKRCYNERPESSEWCTWYNGSTLLSRQTCWPTSCTLCVYLWHNNKILTRNNRNVRTNLSSVTARYKTSLKCVYSLFHHKPHKVSQNFSKKPWRQPAFAAGPWNDTRVALDRVNTSGCALCCTNTPPDSSGNSDAICWSRITRRLIKKKKIFWQIQTTLFLYKSHAHPLPIGTAWFNPGVSNSNCSEG